MASGPITSWQIDGETVSVFNFGAPKSLQMVIAAMKLKDAYSLEGVMCNLDSIFKSRDVILPTKVHLVKAMFFQWLCMDVRIGLWWRLSAEELMLLNCGVGEDSWESLGLQGDQSWVFIGRSDAEAETPVVWPPHVKSWLIGKRPDAGRDWGQKKGTTGDEMAGWHHRLDGHEFEWTLGVSDGQGGLACYDLGGWKSRTQLSDWTNTRLRHPWGSPGKNTGVGCHFLLQCMKVKSESEVAQLFPTLSYPMDCSPPGSSVHGIFQVRVL